MKQWTPTILSPLEASRLSPKSNHQAFLCQWLSQGLQTWISNVEAERLLLVIDEDTWIPVTVNTEEWDNAYTCSRLSALVSYPRMELEKNIAGLSGKLLQPLLKISDRVLKQTSFNAVVQINNWCYPTHAIPQLQPQHWLKIFETFAEKFPRHTLVLRGLNDVQNQDLLRILSDFGLSMQVARQIYIFDPSDQELKKKRMLKSDLNLRLDPNLTLVEHEDFSAADLQRAASLYERLYIDKHCHLNPHFTAEYVLLCHKTRHLEFFGLRYEKSKEIVGVVGILRDWTSDYVHFIGTDLDEPTGGQLYRHLFGELVRRTIHRGRMLNYSSGSAHFKRLRGARATLEYWAFYDSHLPASSRLVNSTIRTVANNIAGPAMEYLKL